MCVCMYVYIYTYICIHTYVVLEWGSPPSAPSRARLGSSRGCSWGCLYMYMYIMYIHIYIYVYHIYLSLSLYIYIERDVSVYMCVYIYIYIYIYKPVITGPPKTNDKSTSLLTNKHCVFWREYLMTIPYSRRDFHT